MKTLLALSAATLAFGAPAVAQDAAPAPTPPAAPAPQAAEISDDQVDRFALAALKVEQIAAKADIDQQQKQTLMATAVQQSGLNAQEFNTIARASQTDPALKQRIQVAATAHVKAATAAQAKP